MSKRVPYTQFAATLWLCLAIGGVAGFGFYSNVPGDPGGPPARWPVDSKLPHISGRPTLLVLVHPQCPCSRATAEELARALASAPAGVADVYAVLADLGGTGPVVWPNEIAGVQKVNDPGGVEIQRFHGQTSGQVLLYDAQGQLAYSGGITESRGHAGDNAGMQSVASLLRGEVPARRSTPVFGCAFQSAARSRP